MNSINIKAYAKINLSLDVIRRKSNGYHELAMIMQTIDLHDNISMSIIDESEIKISSNLSLLSTDENNIVYKASKLFFDYFKINSGIYINIEKNVPISAGLGGGSADAAATLIGLNQLFNTRLTSKELMDFGVQIGADVPFCILKGLALSKGIGEKLYQLKPLKTCYFVLIKPTISISTKYVYENLNLDKIKKRPNMDLILDAIENNDLNCLAKSMVNVLETVTISHHHIIQEIKDNLLTYNPLGVLMSGSGPSVFGLFDDYNLAKSAFNQVKRRYDNMDVFLTKPFYISS